MLQRHLEPSVCPVSRNSIPCVGELCGTPGLPLCLPTWCTLLPGLLVMMLVWAETRCYEQQQWQMFHSCLLLEWPLSLNKNFCKGIYLFFFFFKFCHSKRFYITVIYISWDVYLTGVLSFLSLGLLELHYSQKERKGETNINLQEKEVTRNMTLCLLGTFSVSRESLQQTEWLKQICP